VPTPPTAIPARTPTRALALLACAGFASQAMVRVTDSLLPQIAADFNTTIGAAAMVVTAYAISHGAIQLIIGPAGDRFGKYLSITVACGMASVLVLLCGLVQTLPALIAARFVSGAAAGWIIPLSMAYLGDVIPYERRQPVLARYLSGQILGQLFGQAGGGILGDLMGWRQVFFLLGGILALATLALAFELITNPATRTRPHPHEAPRGFAADYALVLGQPWARTIIIVAFIEGGLAYGIFAYVGADLHIRLGLNFTMVGIIIAGFGIGGLFYALTVRQLVDRLGQTGLAVTGGCLLGAAYATLTFGVTWGAPVAVICIGIGFYMLHNTLQTNATQMTPEARGTAVALFSSALYLGQMTGVAAAAPIVDRYGFAPIFAVAAVSLPILGIVFARALQRHRQGT
jgi:YNFM family putative membrane transporter